MTDLFTYIRECYNGLINESLESSWLRKLMNEVKEKNIPKATLSNLVGYMEIRWDKVTDEYAKEYEANDNDAVKFARKLAKSEANGLIIVLKDYKVSALITNGGHITTFSHWSWDDKWTARSRWASKQYETVDLVKENDTVIFTFDEANDPANVIIKSDEKDSRLSRNISKQGIVFQGDTEYYKKLAQENVKRYKNLMAQAKSSKEFDEKLGERVKAAVDGVMKLSLDMDSNPNKYKSTYSIERLIEMLYSTARYEKGETKGRNGVLPLWKQYLNYSNGLKKKEHDSLADSKYRWAKNAKAQLEKMLTTVEEALKNVQ